MDYGDKSLQSLNEDTRLHQYTHQYSGNITIIITKVLLQSECFYNKGCSGSGSINSSKKDKVNPDSNQNQTEK